MYKRQLNLCVLFAQIAAPFMPETAATIFKAFDLAVADLVWPNRPARELLSTLSHGAQVTPPDVLFRKIEDEDVAAWKLRFGGEA